jgi:phospholipase A1
LLWPPRLTEVTSGYGRIGQLMADDVRHGEIIRKVACFGFYSDLLDQFEDLGFEARGARRLYTLPYDWRLDLERTAGALVALLDRVHADGATTIHVVAHSMGGLVSRLVLESAASRGKPWFASLSSFIALAVPHKGAPLALARVMGLDSALGISGPDFKRFTSDPRYPSGYQLLPAPGDVACWDQGAAAALAPIDPYQADNAGRLGLSLALCDRARWVHETLDAGQAPPHVRYFYFAGTGHETVSRVNVEWDGKGGFATPPVMTRSADAGDGTVPMWSALPRVGQKQLVVNEHSSVFTGEPFKKVFYRLLGGNRGAALQAVQALVQTDAVRVSLTSPVVECHHDFELLLVLATPVPAIAGRIVVYVLDAQGAAPAGRPPSTLAKVDYAGAPVSRLRLLLPALATGGLYQIQFVGQPGNSPAASFAAVDFPQAARSRPVDRS